MHGRMGVLVSSLHVRGFHRTLVRYGVRWDSSEYGFDKATHLRAAFRIRT